MSGPPPIPFRWVRVVSAGPCPVCDRAVDTIELSVPPGVPDPGPVVARHFANIRPGFCLGSLMESHDGRRAP